MSAESLFLFLLLVACLSAVSFKRLKVPYTVGLAVIGFALGIVGEFDQSANSLREAILTPDVILFIFIPPLIFESALHL
ncbi:MAG: cation:proton antiporter, partial [Acidiferrobacterales bacterium]